LTRDPGRRRVGAFGEGCVVSDAGECNPAEKTNHAIPRYNEVLGEGDMAVMTKQHARDLSASPLGPPSLNMNAAGISGPILPEMAAIRSQMVDVRTLLGVWGEPGGEDRVRRRCQPGSPTVIEQVIYLRDLLHATADRLERLVVDAHPVHIAVATCEPSAGYHRWTPEALLPIIAAEIDRLTRLTQELAATDELTPRTRQGLQTITKELLGSAFGDGEQHIRQAERSIEF